jgi:hypothetical protein
MSTAIDYLKKHYQISKDSPIELLLRRQQQESIDSYCDVSYERNLAAMLFNINTFKGRLLLLILNKQLPLSIIDAPKFKELLVYLQLRL